MTAAKEDKRRNWLAQVARVGDAKPAEFRLKRLRGRAPRRGAPAALEPDDGRQKPNTPSQQGDDKQAVASDSGTENWGHHQGQDKRREG